MINQEFGKEIVLVSENVRQILYAGFKANEKEQEDFIQRYQDDIKKFTTDLVKKLFNDINVNLLRRFNKEFKEDSEGKMRNWMQIEEPQINELWAQSKQKIEGLFSTFKHIQIDYDCFKGTPNPQEIIQEGNLQGFMKSASMIYERLLSES